MSAAVRAASSFVRLCVRLYTLGLPPTLRHERLALIDADVYEQAQDGRGEAGPTQLAFDLVLRCLRGAGDDLAWRLLEPHRPATLAPMAVLERRSTMSSRIPGAVFFAVAGGIAWAAVAVLVIEPVAYSMAYAGGLLSLISLAAWSLEARGRVDDEAAPSVWPLLLATGIVGVAAGVVFDGGRLGMLLVAPLALGFTAAWVRELAISRVSQDVKRGESPLPETELARHAAAGEAIAIEAPPERGVTRRAVLRGSFAVGIASVVATMGGVVADFLWQRNVSGFGGVVTAGKAEDFAPGTKTKVQEGKFWLVNLTESQGGPGFLALWQKCPHLGCVVPWNEGFRHVDPETGRQKEGWFRCPCHQSTYNDAGVRVYGPAPRSMDRMAVRVTDEGYIEVDTGDISKGTDDNAAFAVGAERESAQAAQG